MIGGDKVRLRTSQFSESSLSYYEHLIDKIQDLAKDISLARSKKSVVHVIRKDVNRAVISIAKSLNKE